MTQLDDRERSSGYRRLGAWGAPIACVLAMLLAVVGFSASQAEPTGSADEVCEGEDCDRPDHGFWGHQRRGHRFFGHRGAPDPEIAKERMQFASGWMLSRLDVEDDVQEKIQARLETAFDQLMPLVEAHRDGREIWLEAMLGADEVDRKGIEAQRQRALAAADSASAIVTIALADISEMLTPEQREEIAHKIRRRHR